MQSKHYSFTWVLDVLIPNKLYKGQKLTNEVSKNILATTNNKMPSKLPITLVKNNKNKTTAIIIRMLRSNTPMFFFISEIFH